MNNLELLANQISVYLDGQEPAYEPEICDALAIHAWLMALPLYTVRGRDFMHLAIDWLYACGLTDHPSAPIWRWRMYSELLARQSAGMARAA